MTRFARGAGSKAANARAPEQATPWNELQAQLKQSQAAKEDAEKEAQFEAKRKENYENFLKEHKESKIKQVWCEFEDQPSSKNTGNGVLKKNKRKKMEIAKLKAEKNGLLNNSEINGEGDTPKKNETVDQPKPPKGSDEEMDADNEELTTWLNEYSDTEIQNEYDDLTSQLESILKKNEESLGKKNKNVSDSEDKKSDKKKEKNIELTLNTVDDTLELAVDESINEKKSKKKKNKKESSNDCVENTNEFDQLESKKLKKKNKRCIAETVEDLEPIQSDVIQNSVSELDDSNKPTKKRKKNKSTSENKINESDNVQVENNNLPLEKDRKKKNKKRKISECNNIDGDKPTDNCDIDKSVKNKKIKTQTKLQEPHSSDNISQLKNKVGVSNKNNVQNNENNKKNKKDKNGEYARRKPLNEDKTILIVNGEEVEVTTFLGFPILSKDAERLQQLRKNLVSKGITRSEVDRTMKLERRRAEKALSRIKKKLCFHCRKGGHNLSECPELNQKSESTGVPSSGICFKCGSTEHTHFACRVVKTQDFKFASCFICNEQGHISRQCPDNPRGLYPKGGGCRECGDVTHLKKDCPKILQLREDHTMKLDTIESNNIEDISRKQTLAKDNSSKIKHVKF